MIGCEKLCGKCDACAGLVLALQWVETAQRNGWPLENALTDILAGEAARVILAPSSLAELLARALWGRSVDADVLHRNAIDEHPDPDVLFSPDGDVIVYDARNIVEGALLIMPRARAALSRLLAAGLCGPEEALRLLEGT